MTPLCVHTIGCRELMALCGVGVYRTPGGRAQCVMTCKRNARKDKTEECESMRHGHCPTRCLTREACSRGKQGEIIYMKQLSRQSNFNTESFL